jgi:transposase
MSELEFYTNLLNLPKTKVVSVKEEPRKYTFYCEIKQETSKCPSCENTCDCIHQYENRCVQDLSISGKEVWLELKVPQFYCRKCHRYFIHELEWIVPQKSYTQRQSKWIFELCSKQPFSEVACLVNLSSRTIERLYYKIAEEKLKLSEKYAQVRKLGIDEISNRKGKQDYVCVLTDLERGIQLDILKDRKKETLITHFKELGADFCNQIEVVSCDIWKTYILVAQECFPNAKVVLDRFHLVKSLNDVLDTVRKKLRKKEPKNEAFKSIKCILFKQHKNCSETEKKELKELFKQDELLGKIYSLREQFHTLFDSEFSFQEFSQFLNEWKQKATKIDFKPLHNFLNTISSWEEQIVNYAIFPVSNAVTEGLNNIIRYFKRISFGITNFNNMRLRVLSTFS